MDAITYPCWDESYSASKQSITHCVSQEICMCVLCFIWTRMGKAHVHEKWKYKNSNQSENIRMVKIWKNSNGGNIYIYIYQELWSIYIYIIKINQYPFHWSYRLTYMELSCQNWTDIERSSGQSTALNTSRASRATPPETSPQDITVGNINTIEWISITENSMRYFQRKAEGRNRQISILYLQYFTLTQRRIVIEWRIIIGLCRLSWIKCYRRTAVNVSVLWISKMCLFAAVWF